MAEPVTAENARCMVCGWPTERAAELAPAAYLRCTACGFHFQPERPPEHVHELYDEGYFENHAGGGGYSAAAAQRDREAAVRMKLLGRYREPPGDLLEIGSAGGHFLHRAESAGYRGFGVEPVEELAQRSHDDFGVEVVSGFLEDTNLSPAGYDVACAFHVLEHLPNPRAALERIGAAMRPDGLLIVEVPNIESVRARWLRADWPELQPLHHLCHFGPRAIRELLERTEFRVVHVETVSFFTYFRRRMAMQPRYLVHRAALSARARVAPWGAHPDRHELLRAVGVRTST